MTTAGGGWTLIYKVRNDLPDIACPWWSMIALGSGSTFPLTLDPPAAGAEFEGPGLATRSAYQIGTSAGGTSEYRATLRRGTTVLFDERSLAGGTALYYLAAGVMSPPSTYCSDGAIVMAVSAGVPYSVGTTAQECTYGDYSTCTSLGEGVNLPGPTTLHQAVFGTAGYMGSSYSDTNTLIWERDFRGSRP